MAKLAQIQTELPTTAIWLQITTLAWMFVELGISAYAAFTAHSPSMAAFSADSLIETISAGAVLSQWIPSISTSQQKIGRFASIVLFALASVITATSTASLILKIHPAVSPSGNGITITALIAMPILASWKRRESRRPGNPALKADAAQSATCAYLALIALSGLLLNAIFHMPWFDSLGGLLAIPFLIQEGRSAWRGQSCAYC